jgi:hypothetical protein
VAAKPMETNNKTSVLHWAGFIAIVFNYFTSGNLMKIGILLN